MAGHRLHLEVVAEEHATEAQPTAEEIATDVRRHRRRTPAVERRDDDVRCHERGDAGRCRAGEGQEVDRGELAPAAPHAGQDEVRIADRRAVTGEVLAAREHARLREPAREGEREPRDGLRRGAECAVADHAVPRVRPHVEHRGEVEVDPDRAELASHRATDRDGELGVPPLGDRGHRGKVCERRMGQAVDPAAFVVERHKGRHAGAGRVDVGDEPAKLLRRADVPLEEDHPAGTLLGKEVACRAVQDRAGQVDHEQLARRPAEHARGHRQPAIACEWAVVARSASMDTAGGEC